MQVIIHQKGKRKGGIHILNTLLTMGKGEVFETTTSTIGVIYARTAACRASKALNRWYTVTHTIEMGDKIIIKREN